MGSLFFKKQNHQEDHLKRWVVIVFHLVIPVLFGIWGLFLSIASYNLSVETSANREQTDTLISIVNELREQNALLQKSVSIQENQFDAYTGEVKYTKRPRLTVHVVSGDISDTSNFVVKIINTGGDISNLTLISIKGVKIDKQYMSKTRAIVSGGSYDIKLNNVINGSGVRLDFEDGFNNKYSQDLIWSLNNDNFQLGILNERKN